MENDLGDKSALGISGRRRPQLGKAPPCFGFLLRAHSSPRLLSITQYYLQVRSITNYYAQPLRSTYNLSLSHSHLAQEGPHQIRLKPQVYKIQTVLTEENSELSFRLCLAYDDDVDDDVEVVTGDGSP